LFAVGSHPCSQSIFRSSGWASKAFRHAGTPPGSQKKARFRKGAAFFMERCRISCCVGARPYSLSQALATGLRLALDCLRVHEADSQSRISPTASPTNEPTIDPINAMMIATGTSLLS